MGTEKCCQVPTKSRNLRSTISIFLLLANSITSLGVICSSLLFGGAPRGGRSDRVPAALAGADAHDFLDVREEDLAVADPAGARRLLDRLDDLGDEVVGDDD